MTPRSRSALSAVATATLLSAAAAAFPGAAGAAAAGPAASSVPPSLTATVPRAATAPTPFAAPGRVAGLPALSPMTVIAIGDSVPFRLSDAMNRVGAPYGVKVANAAKGSCPGMGITWLHDDGRLHYGQDCAPIVLERQRDAMTAYPNAAAVLWWSRYELADRRAGDGRTHLRAGTPAWWRAQDSALRSTVRRLSAKGAVVVAVAVDRVGFGIRTRADCLPGARCSDFANRLIVDGALRRAWNARLRAYAARDPRLRVITIDDLFCRTAASPCDDRLPMRPNPQVPMPRVDYRTSATLEAAYRRAAEDLFPAPSKYRVRPDGIHVDPGVADQVARVLLDRVQSAARTSQARTAPRR